MSTLSDERRRMLDRRLTPVHLYKLTPKTNCGQCGQPTCLAFATQVIVGQCELSSCHYLDETALGPIRSQLEEQHRAGIGVKREGFEKALEYLRTEIKKYDLNQLAVSVGGEYSHADGVGSLKLAYFGVPILVTQTDVVYQNGRELSPWEKIFLFNYVIGGAVEPSNIWVGMESFPNSVSKIKSLKAHCEDRLAAAFAAKTSFLAACIAETGKPIADESGGADFAAEFRILPKLSVRILWWEEDPEEGFDAKTKFLFDSRALKTLDLESLIFACEQLTDRLLHECLEHSNAGHGHSH